MALDPNIGRIKFLRSKTAGLTPTTADIDEGELALNLVDRTIYTRNGNNIIDMGFGKGGQVNGNITASGTVKATKLEGPLTGNADSATKLQTARAINGVSFDGTANIEVPIKTIRTTAIETDDLSESVFFRSDAGAGTLGIHIHNPADYRYAYQLSQDSSYKSIGLKARVKSGGTWSDYKSLAFTDSDITGNSATATKLQTARTIGITGAVTATAANFDGTSNININATSLDATKLSGTVPNASLNGLYSNVTLDVSNGLVYSLKQPGGNNSVTAYGLGSIRGIAGTTQNSVIVIKTNIPKGSINVLSLHIKGLSDSETKSIDITISGWVRGNISKLSLGTKDYIVRKADSSDGYLCFIISHPSGYLGTSTAFSIVTAHLNFGVDVSTLNNWTIFETTDLSTFTNISQPSPQSTSIVNTYWDNIQSKPTTLAGYGITDTYTRTELDARYSLRTSGVKAITLSTTNLTYTNDNDVSTNVAVPIWNQSTTGNAASATKLQTSRTIGISGASGASGSVSFDGTGNALIPLSVITQPTATNNLTIATTAFVQAVNSADTGSAATALTLKTARTINGTSFNGSANITTANWGTARNFTIGSTTRSVNGASNLSWTLTDIGALGVGDNAVSATKLQTARTINGVPFNGTANITVADSTKLPLSGGTINGDLVVKQNVKVEGITTDRFGFYDKMYWSGAINRPNAENVLVTPLDANRFTAYLTLNSGSQYINFGTSKIHLIQNWASATPNYIQATIDSSVDANAGKQVITLTCTLPNHGILAATNFFWIAITYESFGCEIDQYIANGDLRYVSRLKSDFAFVSKSPIVSISSSSSEWFSGTQSGTGKPEIGPGSQSSAPIVAAVSGQHISFVGVGGIQVPYVTISVKDRII